MVSKIGVLSGAVVVWAATVAFSAGVVNGTPQKTVNDGVYTKAQADGAKAKFDKVCADCHAFTVAERKKLDQKTLGDEPFFDEWAGRTLEELITTIVLTMPNDGSAVITEPEAIDLVAYILQKNGFPEGSAPLTKADMATLVARPKK